MATRRNSSHHNSSSELSIPRINRLLRPLRNKCAIIASATSRPSGSAAPITYGSGPSTLLESRFPPSLDVLRDPKLIISRAHLESRSLDALARQIYAVIDAYRNVVQAALSDDLVGDSRGGVLPLTDICAASVGWSIQTEVGQLQLEGKTDEEAIETSLVDELYESVPTRFRRWTVVAHATSLIVDTCPNYPMLMLSLLGVALNHGLFKESKTFLRLFLTTLIRSPRHGSPPAITHPAHPSYLVELCAEWMCLGLVPSENTCAGASSFTHSAFVAITLDVLIEHGSARAWTCRSVTRLAQRIRTQNFDCFLGFLRALVEKLAVMPKDGGNVSVNEKSVVFRIREEDRPLFARLAKWTGVIASDFFSPSIASGDDAGPADPFPFHRHRQR